MTGPTGAQATSTYDYLGRQVTATRWSGTRPAASYTTHDSYATTRRTERDVEVPGQTSPDGVSTSYGYDAAGEATQVTDGAGNTTRFSFDALGRQTTVTYPDGTSDVTYDAAGQPAGPGQPGRRGADPGQHRATYNGEGQQLSTTDALGNTTAYTYDPTGA